MADQLPTTAWMRRRETKETTTNNPAIAASAIHGQWPAAGPAGTASASPALAVVTTNSPTAGHRTRPTNLPRVGGLSGELARHGEKAAAAGHKADLVGIQRMSAPYSRARRVSVRKLA